MGLLEVLLFFITSTNFFATYKAVVNFSLLQDWANQYYLGLAFVLFLLSIILLFAEFSNTQRRFFRWRSIGWPTLALVIFTVFTRFYGIENNSIWLDEDMQFGRIFLMKNPLAAAAVQHQPPMAYFFSWWSIFIFGQNPLGARFFSALFGVMSVIIFFNLSKKIFKRAEFYWAASTFFIFHQWLVSYSQEARPYSIGLTCFLLFIYSVSEYISSGSRISKLRLLISSLLFLLSLGLQPMILFLCSILVFTTFTTYNYWKVRQWLNIFLILLLVVIVFLPLQWNILQLSTIMIHPRFEYQQFYANFRFTGSLLWKYLEHMEGKILYIGIVYTIFLFWKDEFKKKELMQKFIIGLWFLFPIVLLFFYVAAVELPIQERYIFLHLPLSILLCVFACEHLCEHYFVSYKKNLIYATSIGIALYSYSFAFFRNNRTPIHRDANWQLVYKKLNELVSAKARAFIVTLHDSKHWVIQGFIGAEFYMSNSNIEKIKFEDQWSAEWQQQTQAEIIWDNIGEDIQQIFLLFPANYMDKQIENYNFFLSGAQIRFSTPTFTIVEIQNNFGYAESIRRFFSSVLIQEKNSELRMPIVRILMGLAANDYRRTDYLQYKLELERSVLNDFSRAVFSPEARSIFQKM